MLASLSVSNYHALERRQIFRRLDWLSYFMVASQTGIGQVCQVAAAADVHKVNFRFVKKVVVNGGHFQAVCKGTSGQGLLHLEDNRIAHQHCPSSVFWNLAFLAP